MGKVLEQVEVHLVMVPHHFLVVVVVEEDINFE
jgi:hypothetical protein